MLFQVTNSGGSWGSYTDNKGYSGKGSASNVIEVCEAMEAEFADREARQDEHGGVVRPLGEMVNDQNWGINVQGGNVSMSYTFDST